MGVLSKIDKFMVVVSGIAFRQFLGCTVIGKIITLRRVLVGLNYEKLLMS